MTDHPTTRLGDAGPETAPDGSLVRPLLAVRGGSLAHFTFAPGLVSRAVAHRHVDEIWLVTGGRGEMWRGGDRASVTALEAGVCVAIPARTPFQVRVTGDEPLTVVGATMPAWPGEGEAMPATGPWPSGGGPPGAGASGR